MASSRRMDISMCVVGGVVPYKYTTIDKLPTFAPGELHIEDSDGHIAVCVETIKERLGGVGTCLENKARIHITSVSRRGTARPRGPDTNRNFSRNQSTRDAMITASTRTEN